LFTQPHTCSPNHTLSPNFQVGDLEAFGSNRTAALKQQAASRDMAMQSPQKAGGGTAETKEWLCYVIFDILYLKGGEKEAKLVREAHSGASPGCISGLPLRCRRALLEKLVTPVAHRIELISKVVVDSGSNHLQREKVLFDQMDRAIQGSWEGVMVS
jgi:ATP-dependent DNA ligase